MPHRISNMPAVAANLDTIVLCIGSPRSAESRIGSCSTTGRNAKQHTYFFVYVYVYTTVLHYLTVDSVHRFASAAAWLLDVEQVSPSASLP